MSNTVQLFAVLALVVLAAGFLARRYWRSHKGLAPACGNCNECHCGPDNGPA